MSKTITLDQIKNGAPLRYVDTLYGGQMGVRRMSLKLARRCDELHRDASSSFEASRDVTRDVVRWCVQDPKLDDDTIAKMEDDAPAWAHLLQQLAAVNARTPAAQVEIDKTFRAGNGEPGPAPAASE